MTQESSIRKTCKKTYFIWALLVFSAFSSFFLLERITAAIPASCAQVSYSIEGEGFDSPEDAALAYLEGLRDLDLNRMISTFAVESYAKNYNFEATLNRVKVYQFGLEIKLPNANEFVTALNIESRRSRVSYMVLCHYMFLCDHEFDPVEPLPMKEETDVLNFIAQFKTSLSAPSFKTLKILGFIPPSAFSEFYDNPRNTENIARVAASRGADSQKSCVAVFSLDRKEYVFCLDAISYGGKWYIAELGGNTATLKNIVVLSMGTMPISDKVRDKVHAIITPVK